MFSYFVRPPPAVGASACPCRLFGSALPAPFALGGAFPARLAADSRYLAADFRRLAARFRCLAEDFQRSAADFSTLGGAFPTFGGGFSVLGSGFSVLGGRPYYNNRRAAAVESRQKYAKRSFCNPSRRKKRAAFGQFGRNAYFCRKLTGKCCTASSLPILQGLTAAKVTGRSGAIQ